MNKKNKQWRFVTIGFIVILTLATFLIGNFDRNAKAVSDIFPDIFIYDKNTGSWSIKFNNGSGTFSEKNGSWDPQWSVQAANFNGDDLTDFFLYKKTTGQWFKAINNGSDDFTYSESGTFSTDWNIYIMNLNGDGISDVFFYNFSNGVWAKCNSVIGNGFSCAQSRYWSANWQVYPTRINSDSYDDLFLYNPTNGAWYRVINDGNLNSDFSYPLNSQWSPNWQIYPADFNGDGLSDILLYGPANTPTGYVAINNGSDFSYPFSANLDRDWDSLSVADFNGDDKADIFFYKKSNGIWVQAINNGSGTDFAYYSGVWDVNWQVYISDFDNNSRSDILVYNSQNGNWVSLIYNSPGVFSQKNGNWGVDKTIIAETADTSRVLNNRPIQFGVSPPEIKAFSSNLSTASPGQSVVLAWEVSGAAKLIFNPGNVDVTNRNSYSLNFQSDTLYNLTAENGAKKTVSKVFVKNTQRLPSKMTGLWVGPRYNPTSESALRAERKDIPSLRQDFGAKMIMYNLDWLFYDYFNSNNFRSGNYSSNIARINAFCNARISEANSNNTDIFWATIVPFEKGLATAYKSQYLNDIASCFNSSRVLGIHTIDEPGAPIEAGNTGVAWSKVSLQEGYNLFKTRFPDKYIWYNEAPGLSVNQMNGYDWGDIVSIDYYPINNQPADINVPATYASYYQDVFQLAGIRDRWFVHQAVNNYAYTNNPSHRTPTPNELQAMANYNWSQDFQGLIWWGTALNNYIPQHFTFIPGLSILNDFIPDNLFKATLMSINGNPPTPTPAPTPTPTPTPTPVTKIIRFQGDPQIYVQTPDSQLKWIPTPQVFQNLNLDWNKVEVKPAGTADQYMRAKLLRADNDTKVYYITESGMKRWMLTAEIFLSYGNKWEDIVTVKQFELDAIPDNILIYIPGDAKIYKLEGNIKRWIVSVDAFTRNGFKWDEVAPVNQTELDGYVLGSDIE